MDHVRMAVGNHLRGRVCAFRLERRGGAGGGGGRARRWSVDALPAARTFADTGVADGHRGGRTVGPAPAGAAACVGAAAHGGLGGGVGSLHGPAWAFGPFGAVAARAL